jgi:glutamyl-tRNA(Gln) amidotransferase subunit D
MMSENMRFAHYNLIAKEIEKAVQEGTDGIIITHGTDMLHYTAAALSFVLENLPVPVILVGAQRSSDRGSSDAFLNLQWAAQFIAHSDFAEVAICMHDSAEDTLGVILPGTKSRKMHSSRRDAFKAINARPWAKVKSNGAIEWLRRNYNTSADQKLKLRLFKEDLKIGLLKAHPNMFAEEIKAYSKFDGLILEGTGLGHFPTERYDENTKEHDHIFKEIVKLAGKIPVVMTVQTIFGMVNMNVYTPGRRLIEAGVLGNGLDLTSETAWIKLAWLLSNYSPKEVPSLWAKNFRGEISAQRGYEREFL